MNVRMLALLTTMTLISGIALAGQHSEKERLERAGNCSDAKQQMAYFCDESNAGADSMVAIGTACTNAKNNVKAACEGVDTPDAEYKFDD